MIEWMAFASVKSCFLILDLAADLGASGHLFHESSARLMRLFPTKPAGEEDLGDFIRRANILRAAELRGSLQCFCDPGTECFLVFIDVVLRKAPASLYDVENLRCERFKMTPEPSINCIADSLEKAGLFL